MIDSLGAPIHRDQLLRRGRNLSPDNFLSAAEASPSMKQMFAGLSRDLLDARGLEKFAEVGQDMLGRTVCLPTTTLMAIRHLGGDKALTLDDFYRLGVYAHVNDRQRPDGSLEKGFPSFHRGSLDTYLRYALEFAKIAGLNGGIITGFKDLAFADAVVKDGAAIVSVDNLFIPGVMCHELDGSTFKPSRHAELVHNVEGDNVVISDVTNSRNGIEWNTVNRVVSKPQMEQYLTCPRLNDGLTRAVVLTPDAAAWQRISRDLKSHGIVEEPHHNPILAPFFGKGVGTALHALGAAADKGLAQWDLIQQ